MRGATVSFAGRNSWRPVSTHAPHARCDSLSTCPPATINVSTHAPHARCDLRLCLETGLRVGFYSRTSCEVRPLSSFNCQPRMSFYSRTSCEVRLDRYDYDLIIKSFYSRTSCEVRLPSTISLFTLIAFPLTHLMRGATTVLPFLVTD